MALNTTGPISLAGSTTGQSIALELGQSATGQISLNDSAVRTLAGVASGAIIMPTNFYGKSSHVPYSTKVTYTANTTLTAPYANLRVKCWGASAGGANGMGAGAGFAQADIAVTVGNTLLIAVGGGGLATATTGTTISGGTNGGGSARCKFTNFWVSSGGGYSGVFINNSATQANAKIIAGGAGGNYTSTSWAGGVGGGTTGGTALGGTSAGGGGTQTAGGTAGTGVTGTTAGSALQGGGVSADGMISGAGGGYFGGGSGRGAGGGSGYVTGTNTTLTQGNTSAAGGSAANTGDADYVAGKGNGVSTSGAQGQPGYVVIYY